MDGLKVADRGAAARAPRDERLAAVHEARVPQPLEGDAHGPRAPLVHGEALAPPVDAGAEPAMLRADDRARLVHEAPHALQVALPTQRGAALPLLGDDLVEDELRADAGVVDTGQPQRVVAAHAVVADQGVLDGGDERVTDVQRAGDVGRRLDDDEPLCPGRGLGGGREGVRGQPTLVDGGLDRGGVVARGELASRRGHRSWLLHRYSDKRPLVEGRTGSSWYHLRSRPMWPPRHRAIGRLPAGSRATSPSRCAAGLQPSWPASLERPLEGYSSRSLPSGRV